MSDIEDATTALGNSEVLSVKNPEGPPIPEFCQPLHDGEHVPPTVLWLGVLCDGFLVFRPAVHSVGRRSALFASAGGENASDVLDDHPTGSEFSNDAMELPPQSAPVSSQASTLASHADVLTWESADNKVNCWEASGAQGDLIPVAMAVEAVLSRVCATSCAIPCPFDDVCAVRTASVDVPNIGAAGHVWPVPLQDVAAGGVDLDLPRALPSGTLEAEVKAANSGEQGDEFKWSAHVMRPPANAEA
jgi:hypothetical protein